VFAREGGGAWLAGLRSNALTSFSVAKPKTGEAVRSRWSAPVKRTVYLSGEFLARTKALRVEEGSSFHDVELRGDLGVFERACAVFRSDAGAGFETKARQGCRRVRPEGARPRRQRSAGSVRKTKKNFGPTFAASSVVKRSRP
jgi:hypothetical protein